MSIVKISTFEDFKLALSKLQTLLLTENSRLVKEDVTNHPKSKFCMHISQRSLIKFLSNVFDIPIKLLAATVSTAVRSYETGGLSLRESISIY